MTAFRVVVDSSCVIGLTHIDLLQHLPNIFQEISIPDFVYHEVVINGHGRPGAAEVARAVQEGWLVQRTVQDTLARCEGVAHKSQPRRSRSDYLGVRTSM